MSKTTTTIASLFPKPTLKQQHEWLEMRILARMETSMTPDSTGTS
jgi:hypothetical protein